MGEFVMVDAHDGRMSAFLERPAGEPRAAVVVLHEIFGINADMRETCAWLAGAGFCALCPDLFWRMEPGVELTDATPQEWDKAIGLYQAFDREAGLSDVHAAMGHARTLGGGKVGIMGYCLGGLMTFRTAARFGADAAVAYYGGETEKYLQEAGQLRTPLMAHLAGDDEYMPLSARQAIEATLAGKPEVEVHVYPGRRHAFARHQGAHYEPAAAALANERTLRFFHQYLG